MYLEKFQYLGLNSHASQHLGLNSYAFQKIGLNMRIASRFRISGILSYFYFFWNIFTSPWNLKWPKCPLHLKHNDLSPCSFVRHSVAAATLSRASATLLSAERSPVLHRRPAAPNPPPPSPLPSPSPLSSNPPSSPSGGLPYTQAVAG